MAAKTTGAEFKRFYTDADFWPEDGGDTYHDDEVFTVNGQKAQDGIDIDHLADDAMVEIEGGMVFGPKWDGDEPSLEEYFERWRDAQQTASFLVECDQSKLDAVKAAIAAAGGRVK